MRLIPFLTALICAAPAASAHEFWISPEAYMIQPGDQLVANLRVGENFKGGASPFLPSRFARFDLVQGDVQRTGLVVDASHRRSRRRPRPVAEGRS